MRRGRPGVAGLKRNDNTRKAFTDAGAKIESGQMEHIGIAHNNAYLCTTHSLQLTH
jgi:hypothetical protein